MFRKESVGKWELKSKKMEKKQQRGDASGEETNYKPFLLVLSLPSLPLSFPSFFPSFLPKGISNFLLYVIIPSSLLRTYEVA